MYVWENNVYVCLVNNYQFQYLLFQYVIIDFRLVNLINKYVRNATPLPKMFLQFIIAIEQNETFVAKTVSIWQQNPPSIYRLI